MEQIIRAGEKSNPPL